MAQDKQQAPAVLADLDNYPHERVAVSTLIGLARQVHDADVHGAATYDNPTVRKERLALSLEALLNFATEAQGDLINGIRRLEMGLLGMVPSAATGADLFEEACT